MINEANTKDMEVKFEEMTSEEFEAKAKSIMEKDKPESVAYFYNEHYGSYFGVTKYTLNDDGSYKSGIPSGEYNKAYFDENGVPYIGVKKENKNILYI